MEQDMLHILIFMIKFAPLTLDCLNNFPIFPSCLQYQHLLAIPRLGLHATPNMSLYAGRLRRKTSNQSIFGNPKESRNKNVR
jgi:hypothetical protein